MDIQHKKIKLDCKTQKEEWHRKAFKERQGYGIENQLRMNTINQKKWVLSWLTSHLIKDQGFNQSKSQIETWVGTI